jgi:hypothetical protein
MKEGDIVYHINCGTERFRIKKIFGTVASCSRIDLPMTRNCRYEMNYPTAICSIENLRESLENTNQLSLF